MNKWLASLCLRMGGRILTVVWAYGPNCSSAYPHFFESLEGLLEGTPGGSLVLLGDLNAHVGSDSETRRGVIWKNGPANLNLSGVLLVVSWLLWWRRNLIVSVYWDCLAETPVSRSLTSLLWESFNHVPGEPGDIESCKPQC